MKKSKQKLFFGKVLLNNGSFWTLPMGKVQVALWSHVEVETAKRVWMAKLFGPNVCELIIVQGRTPGEALRRLEKKTLAMVRDFVRTFAIALAQISTELLRVVPSNLPQSKKS